MSHLYVGAPMPTEYLTLYLCRDVFHCTPSQLRKEDPRDILAAITCLEAEAEVRKQEENGKPKWPIMSSESS